MPGFVYVIFLDGTDIQRSKGYYVLQICCDIFPRRRIQKVRVHSTSVILKQTYVMFWHFSRMAAAGVLRLARRVSD